MDNKPAGDLESEHRALKEQYREMEERYRQAMFRLRTHETLSVRSIAGLEQKAILLDFDLNILYVNTALAAALSIKREEMRGKPLSTIDRFPWGPGYLTLLTVQCRSIAEDIVKERTYFDKGSGRELTVRITVARVDGGYQITLEDRTRYVELEKRFARYLPSSVLERMRSEGLDADAPRRCDLSVIAVDMREFPVLAATLSPNEWRDLMSAFHANLIEAADRNNAMVYRFTGSGLLVVCGAPVSREDHAVQAVRTALEMASAHRRFIAHWKESGRTIPGISIGVGTGEAMAGSLGEGPRSEYAVIGEAAEQALKLCGMAGPGKILISDALRIAVIKADPGAAKKLEVVAQEGLSVPAQGGLSGVFAISPEGELPDLVPESPGKEQTRIVPREKRVFGKYQLLEEIGYGGMGLVYRAMHMDIGRVVALKILKGASFAQEQQIRMFRREIEAMAKLNHPNLISIHDVGVVDGQHYFTMDYIDGCTLDELMTGLGQAKERGAGSTLREIVEHIQRAKSTPRRAAASGQAAPPAPAPVVKPAAMSRALW